MVVQRTGIEEWREICKQIRACGYDAIEIWVALVEKCADDLDRAKSFREAMHQNQLKAVALAGTLNDTTARICKLLDIPCACAGYGGSNKETVIRLMRETGILFNYENHPEKKRRVDSTTGGIRSEWIGCGHRYRLALHAGS